VKSDQRIDADSAAIMSNFVNVSSNAGGGWGLCQDSWKNAKALNL